MKQENNTIPGRSIGFMLVVVLSMACVMASAAEKPRVFVLTDIENEPDDAMSMVRFLTYANHYDIEGLVATTSIHQRGRVAPQRIRRIVEAYGQVRDNLEEHEPGFPTAEFLLRRISEGLPVYGMDGVGTGKDSPGSERLIQAVDKDDPRPLWVTVWGGPSVLAQALWKVRATRSADELERFVAKLRVYTISDQDNSGPWLRQEFPGLFYIASPGFNAGGAYHHATWSGISGDYFHARFVGADFTLVTNEWLDRHIRSKGPLGAEYPLWEYLMEGDTPSFLNLIDNGLSDPDHPNWGGWGGRYELYTPHPAEVAPSARNPSVLDRCRGRGHGHRRLVAHGQSRHDLALACGLSKRLRRADGLDHQALRRGQPSACAQARPCQPAHRQTWRARQPQRRGIHRSGR